MAYKTSPALCRKKTNLSPEEKHVLGQRDGITAPPGYKAPKKYGEPIEIHMGGRGEGKSFTALKEIWKKMGGKEAVPISTVHQDTYDLQPRSWTKVVDIQKESIPYIPTVIPAPNPPSILPNPFIPVQKEPEEKKTIQKKIVKEPKKPEKKDRFEAVEILPTKPKKNAGDE